MKTLRAVALLLTAMFALASSASALPITLTSYSVSANTSGNDGLEVDVDPLVAFGGDVTTPDLA